MSRRSSSPAAKAESFRRIQASYNQHKLGEIPPQDSDTDSGICADSEQSSPKQPVEIPRFFSPTNYADCINRESYRSSLASLEDPLPQRPPPSNTAAARNVKTYRVRFADEVDSGASTSSSCSDQSNRSMRDVAAFRRRQQATLDNPQATLQYADQMSRPKNGCSSQANRMLEKPSDVYSCTILEPDHLLNYGVSSECMKSSLEPPPYELAINRLRQKEKFRESIRDFVIRQNVNEALNRKFRNRSSSLPRIERCEIPELYRTSLSNVNSQVHHLQNPTRGSLETLNFDSDASLNNNNNTPRRRRLPVAPVPGPFPKLPGYQCENDQSSQNFSSFDHRCPRERVQLQRFSRRSTSIGPKCEILEYGTRRKTPPVRAILVALDRCGFRTVLVEKTQPGAFGFYIATGTMNGQRGIFISRISIASLSPMLSVGDEILYVDDQLVRGRSLETVQALIAGKTKVFIVLLPAIGKYVY